MPVEATPGDPQRPGEAPDLDESDTARNELAFCSLDPVLTAEAVARANLGSLSSTFHFLQHRRILAVCAAEKRRLQPGHQGLDARDRWRECRQNQQHSMLLFFGGAGTRITHPCMLPST